MNYQETLNYLFNRLPMYQRVGAAAYKVDLKNTLRLCTILGNPESNFKSIHVAGTNGKGSVSHMIASVFQQAGYKVGLYTSPHLKEFRERVKINGKMISEDRVIHFVEKYKKEFEEIDLSFFEWTVGLAFNYFSEEQVDVAIIETGLGGRLDSTNVLSPLLSVITNIGLDHTQFLGDTLEKIAFEKAGIIKSKIPVVIGETNPVTKLVFDSKAREAQTSIIYADSQPLYPYSSDLKGNYQIKNIQTTAVALHKLKGLFDLSEIDIVNGLNSVAKNTGLMGRWQVLSEKPKVICDTAHNVEGVSYIVKQLSDYNYNQLHIVWGMVNDKAIEKVLRLLPKNASYYFCRPNIPRGMNAEELKSKAETLGLSGTSYVSVQDAKTSALKNAKQNDLVFIGGSTFVVAEVV